MTDLFQRFQNCLEYIKNRNSEQINSDIENIFSGLQINDLTLQSFQNNWRESGIKSSLILLNMDHIHDDNIQHTFNISNILRHFDFIMQGLTEQESNLSFQDISDRSDLLSSSLIGLLSLLPEFPIKSKKQYLILMQIL